MSERIEPGAEAAHRDDLARDVARLWAVKREAGDRPSNGPWLDEQIGDALDRLTSAYASRVDHRPRKRSACCDEALDEHGHCMYCDV